MANKLRYNDNELQELLDGIKAQILSTRVNAKAVNISFSLQQTQDNATLQFTPTAWCKMYALVDDYKGEVEWHGIVNRITNNVFVVKDILIFPHEVSSTSVTSDPKKYSLWLNSLDDETFNHLRFHGHSHVNMGVNPSSIDINYRNNILCNFKTPTSTEDLFYIFLITNKRRELEAEIYDYTNNIVYHTNDIKIEVILENDCKLSDFIEEAHAVTVERNTVNQVGFGGCSEKRQKKNSSNKTKDYDSHDYDFNWYGREY